ncbi:outer membrane beta-barrel protein [Sediminicoccus sp. KRV36]|uniref:outer membrane beta-barrel protein n=1 Tax=Sediminicoccus sp. KRV36 TaxID=3133721 RepID=UPI00200C2DC6|nr:outer membrane beta-barrel protein [Sediminicoccus rosea]UPY39120.1 outer membrane beta-barrel protein [Sediminicoccus rosea]
MASCLFSICISSIPEAAAQGSGAEFAVPTHGLYIGAGGSLNVTNFGTQNVYALGLSDVYQNGVRVSSGSAAGPARVPMGSEVGFAPSAQIGYYQNFAESRWLWGVKAGYSYLGTTATTPNALLPQAGAYTYTQSGLTVPFLGNGVVRSYQTRSEHQVALTPFLGRSYERGFLYLGAGPTLTRLNTQLNGLIGFADINGNRSDISGAPQNFSSSGWVWGAMLVVGATYFVTPSWFLDFTYTASATQRQAGNYYSTFSNPNGPAGAITTGALIGNSSGGLVTQGATLTLNRRF